MIYIAIPGTPPTSNKAYFTIRAKRGGTTSSVRVLTKEGKRYKSEVKDFLARKGQQVLSFFKQQRPYSLMVRFNMHGLTSKTYKEGGKRNRYKKMDVGNRLKLFEDALVEACGHDDSQHFQVFLWKREIPEDQEPCVELWAWCEDDGEHYHVQLEQLLYTVLTTRTGRPKRGI